MADAVADCGPYRVHPQKTRIAFITVMTFAGVKLAREWVDVSFITPTPVGDERISRIECYGPTSFAHTVRLHHVSDIDPTLRQWLRDAWRRGNRETLDPDAHVSALTGIALARIVVPLRVQVVEHDGDLALRIPRYAAEIFAGQHRVLARVNKSTLTGTIDATPDTWHYRPEPHALRTLGLGHGDPVDATLHAVR